MGVDELPATVEECLEFTRDLERPISILVRRKDKFFEILNYEMAPMLEAAE